MQLPNFSQVKGVIFDLDGTLMESTLNFQAIRKQIGCPPQEDLLHFIENIPCEKQQKAAHKIVLEHELADAHTAKWLPVGKAMVEAAQALGLPMAIVTRNCKQASQIKLTNNQAPISLVLTREDAPPKPNPTALLMIAQQWQFAPEHLIYVGDFRYDKEAAINAGMQWWLV